MEPSTFYFTKGLIVYLFLEVLLVAQVKTVDPVLHFHFQQTQNSTEQKGHDLVAECANSTSCASPINNFGEPPSISNGEGRSAPSGTIVYWQAPSIVSGHGPLYQPKVQTWKRKSPSTKPKKRRGKKHKKPRRNKKKMYKLVRPNQRIHKSAVVKSGSSACNGYHNFIKDLEYLSLKLGLAGFKKATVGFVLHALNQIYATFSVLKIGLPERISTFIETVFPDSVPPIVTNILSIGGMLDYIVTLFFSYPIGNIIVAIEALAEILTLASLVLGVITTFDGILEDKLRSSFGIDLQKVFEGYGCAGREMEGLEQALQKVWDVLD